MKSIDLIKVLKKDGWELKSIKGSHHKFKHPTKDGMLIVPHPKKNLGIGIVNSILKTAGLK